MKNLFELLLFAIAAGLALMSVATTALADDTVHFTPEIKGQQYFECNATSGDFYNLQTRNVKMQGACPSGKVEGVSKDTLNNSYFSVKDAGKNPSVEITGNEVKCGKVEQHTKPNDFGAGQGFCASPIAENKR
jgi:hypothetical protein